MKSLVDVHFPLAESIRVVIDNLNIHTPAALYETFEPQEARRILKKLEFHYTPKHGSWLNQVEIELSVLSRQCLERRIPDQETFFVFSSSPDSLISDLSISTDLQISKSPLAFDPLR